MVALCYVDFTSMQEERGGGEQDRPLHYFVWPSRGSSASAHRPARQHGARWSDFVTTPQLRGQRGPTVRSEVRRLGLEVKATQEEGTVSMRENGGADLLRSLQAH